MVARTGTTDVFVFVTAAAAVDGLVEDVVIDGLLVFDVEEINAGEVVIPVLGFLLLLLLLLLLEVVSLRDIVLSLDATISLFLGSISPARIIVVLVVVDTVSSRDTVVVFEQTEGVGKAVPRLGPTDSSGSHHHCKGRGGTKRTGGGIHLIDNTSTRYASGSRHPCPEPTSFRRCDQSIAQDNAFPRAKHSTSSL